MTEAIALLLRLANEEQARSIVAALATPAGAQTFERIAAVARARKLLDDGLERRDVAHRIAGRYEISVATAYRRIGEALELRRPILSQHTASVEKPTTQH